MISNPVLVAGIFNVKAKYAIDIVDYLDYNYGSMINSFYAKLFLLLEESLNKISMCGGKNMVGLVPYIKEGKVDNNIVVIIQEVGGVVKIFRFMECLLLNGSEKLKGFFFNCIFHNEGFPGALERARRIFYDANILLMEKPEEVWAFAYKFARLKYCKVSENENPDFLDLVGATFIRGHIYLSGLHLKILSDPSIMNEEKFFDEIKSETNKYENHEQEYTKLWILFLSPFDYVGNYFLLKNLLKSLDDGLLEGLQGRLQEKLISKNFNGNSGSVYEKYGYEPIEEICLRLVNIALKVKNAMTNVGTRGMGDTRLRGTRCNHEDWRQHRRAAPQMNNLGAPWRR
jgi:hypothetical protein